MAKASRIQPTSLPNGRAVSGWAASLAHQQEAQAQADPEAAVSGERGGAEHVPVAELPHAGQQLAQAAVGERVAEPGQAAGVGHPAGVERRQQECGQGEGGEPKWRVGYPRRRCRRSCRWSSLTLKCFLLMRRCAARPRAGPDRDGAGLTGSRRQLERMPARWPQPACRGEPDRTAKGPSSVFTGGSAEPHGRSALSVTLDTRWGRPRFLLMLRLRLSAAGSGCAPAPRSARSGWPARRSGPAAASR